MTSLALTSFFRTLSKRIDCLIESIAEVSSGGYTQEAMLGP